MDPSIEIRRGRPEEREAFLDFINLVFGYNGRENDFLKLLPKLYEAPYQPMEHNLLVLQGGRIRAAVGLYPLTLEVAGETLHAQGIGNVAAHPRDQGKGYMKALMSRALEACIASGADFSFLSGRRQRYGYFSYEKAGTVITASIDERNLRHCFPEPDGRKIEIAPLLRENEAHLRAWSTLSRQQPLFARRAPEALYDILKSWECTPLVFLEEGRFLGGCVAGGRIIGELTLANDADFYPAVRALIGRYGGIELKLPPFSARQIAEAAAIAENIRAENLGNFAVFHFEKVAGAFLKLRCRYETPEDFTLPLLVHGPAGEEAFTLSASGGVSAARPGCGEDALELDAREAVSLLFSSFSPWRTALSARERSMLPLPLFLHHSDAV